MVHENLSSVVILIAALCPRSAVATRTALSLRSKSGRKGKGQNSETTSGGTSDGRQKAAGVWRKNAKIAELENDGKTQDKLDKSQAALEVFAETVEFCSKIKGKEKDSNGKAGNRLP